MAKIRETYDVRHEGSISGLPGIWPAGATVTVERDSQTGLCELVQVLPGPGGEVKPKAQEPAMGLVESPAAETGEAVQLPATPGSDVLPPVMVAGPTAPGEFVIPSPMQFSDTEGGL